MFCTNCGRQIPDGQQSCQFCNPTVQEPAPAPQPEQPVYAPPVQTYTPPVEEPVFTPPVQEPVFTPPVQEPVYTPPVQEQPVYTPPVQQPVYAPPVQEQPVYTPPVQQPVYAPPVQQPVYAPQQPVYAPQQPSFELNMPAEGKKKNKKKSGGGKIALIIIALVLVAGIVLAAFNWKSITRFFARNFGTPTQYISIVEKEAAAEVAEDIATSYDTYLQSYNPDGAVTEATVTLEAGDALMTTLNAALSASGMDMDLSWVESISLSSKVEMYETTMRVDAGVALNGVHIATVSMVWDMESQMIYIGCPELHDTYIQFDATELMGYEAEDMAETMRMSQQMTAELMELMPSGQELQTLINTYWGIIVDGLQDAEKANEKVNCGGLEQQLLVVTVELSQKDILKIVGNILEEAKDDEIIKDLIKGFDDYASQMNGYDMGLYDEYSYMMEELLDEMDDIIEEADGSDFITLETFIDGKDQIVGRNITVDNGYEEIEVYYITVTEGKEFAFQAELATVAIEGEGTIEGDKRTGSYTLTESGNEYITLELDGFSCVDGNLDGTLRLVPGDALLYEMDMSSAASVLSTAALELTFSGDSIRVAIEMSGSEMVALTLSGKTGSPSPISIPNGVSSEDEAGGMQWLSELDLNSVVTNLNKAGVPDEYMSMVEQLVESFNAEFG